MRRMVTIVLSVFLFCGVAVAPLAVSAATPFDRAIVPCTGIDCSFCDLATLAQNILNTGIYLAVFLSAFLFAYAGGLLLTAGGDVGKMKKGKAVFLNVALGLFIILVAWLLVDTLMKMATGGALGPWNRIC